MIGRIILAIIALIIVVWVAWKVWEGLSIENYNNEKWTFGNPTFAKLVRSYGFGPTYPLRKNPWYSNQSLSKIYPANVIYEQHPQRTWAKVGEYYRNWPSFDKPPIQAPKMLRRPYTIGLTQ